MSTLTNVRLPQNRSRQLDERGIRLLRTRTRQQGLARSGRAVEQNALRRLDSHALEELGLCEGKLNDLASSVVNESTSRISRIWSFKPPMSLHLIVSFCSSIIVATDGSTRGGSDRIIIFVVVSSATRVPCSNL